MLTILLSRKDISQLEGVLKEKKNISIIYPANTLTRRVLQEFLHLNRNYMDVVNFVLNNKNGVSKIQDVQKLAEEFDTVIKQLENFSVKVETLAKEIRPKTGDKK